MSESDKTREKLLDSMRKTKTGTAEKEPANTTAEKTEPEKTQPAAPGNKAARAARKPSKKKPQSGVDVDAYQSRQRRVWPD